MPVSRTSRDATPQQQLKGIPKYINFSRYMIVKVWYLGFFGLSMMASVASFVPFKPSAAGHPRETHLHLRRVMRQLLQQRRQKFVQQALVERRTVNQFETTPVPTELVDRALKAAIMAPCHKMTEPWRFIRLGPKTIEKIAKLNAASVASKDPVKAAAKERRWQAIPGWCVVTSSRSLDNDVQVREDYAATSCAIQNFMLSLWAAGVGTKWTSGPITRTPEFAELCGIDLAKEHVVGCIWYGYAAEGLHNIPTPVRRKDLSQVSMHRP
jgi:nitroreductase